MPGMPEVEIESRLTMSPRIRVVIALWQPAASGSSWSVLGAAWETLHTLVTEAARIDRRERS